MNTNANVLIRHFSLYLTRYFVMCFSKFILHLIVFIPRHMWKMCMVSLIVDLLSTFDRNFSFLYISSKFIPIYPVLFSDERNKLHNSGTQL